MIRCLINSYPTRSSLSRALNTLVATEEFPFGATLVPHKPAPAVVSETTLDNGIKVITRDCHSPIVTMKFSLLGGSSSELPHQKGAAHFLSLAAYSGNKKNTGLRVVRFLESLGSSIKASSDREKITYEVSVLADRVEPVVAGVMSVIASPPHATYVLEEAKESAELAYSAYSQDSQQQLLELLHEAAYGEESGLGSSRFASSVRRIDMEAVLEYRRHTFVSNNLVVTANGISNDKLKVLLSLHGDLLINSSSTTTTASSPYVGGHVRVRVDLDGNNNNNNTNLGVAFPVPSGDAGKPYLLLSELLSSKFQKEKNVSSSSSVFLYNNNNSEGGLLTITTAGTVASATSSLTSAIKMLQQIATTTSSSSSPLEGLVAAKNKVALRRLGDTDAILASLSSSGVGVDGDVRQVSDSSVILSAKSLLKSVPSYAVLGTTAGTPSYAAIHKMISGV